MTGFIIFFALLVFVTLLIRFINWSSGTSREKELNNLNRQQLEIEQERIKKERENEKN
jgi:hypothetical protein